LDQSEVLVEIRALKTRAVSAIVVVGQIFEALDLPGQETTSERTVGDKADAESPTGRKHTVFRIPAPQRVLGLQRSDRVNLARALEGFGTNLAEPEKAHLAF